jgi:hypothetical protein
MNGKLTWNVPDRSPIATDVPPALVHPIRLSTLRLVGVAVASLLLVLLMREAAQFVHARLVAFDLAYYWPISVFQPRMPDPGVLARAAGAALVFGVVLRSVVASGYTTTAIVGGGLALLIASNSIQGWADGIPAPIAYDSRSAVFVPVSADGEQYYHDALRVSDPAAFLRTYEVQQPTLHQHTRTHPPGPVLLLYALNRALPDPALIAIALAGLSLTLSTIWFSRMLAAESPAPVAGYVSFLFVLLPAVQIYYLATVDAVVAALVIGVAHAFRRPGWMPLLAASLLTSLALFLTFAALFVLPLVVGLELLRERRVTRSAALLACVAGAYGLLYLASGFNWLSSFAIASQVENPRGFRLLVDPVNYLFTRFEGIAEIVLFLGPFAGLLLWRGLRSMRLASASGALFALACITLLLMFGSGAFRTGETARICLFIYPFLLLPVARYLSRLQPTKGEQARLASLVFAQSLMMQTAGIFYW